MAFRKPRKKETLSSCCILNESGTQYTCIDSLTETECDFRNGIWSGLSGGKPVWCGSSPCPEAPRSSIQSKSANDSSSITSTIRTKLESINIGDEFEGGTYIGTFKPGTPINGNGIEIHGNEFTGPGQLYTSRGHGPGGNSQSWALIVDSVDYNEVKETKGLKLPENYKVFATSFYDGHYNTHGRGKLFAGLPIPVVKLIKLYDKNGHKDWYIPSQDELAFINWTLNQTNDGKILNQGNDNFTKMFGSYLTSTIFSHRDVTDPENIAIRKQNIKGNKYVYAQKFNMSREEGFVQLTPNEMLSSDSSSCYIRLVRRILL